LGRSRGSGGGSMSGFSGGCRLTPPILVATRARADVLILPLFSASAARSFFQQLGRHCACVPLALLLLLRQAPCFDEELCKKTGTIGRSV